MTSRSKNRKESTTTTRNYPLPSPLPPSNNSPIQDEFERLFAHLKQEIQEYHALAQSVQSFKHYIENGMKEGIFDQEDMEWIDNDLKELLESKEKKEQELMSKETLYRNSVLKLEDILARRKNAIEEAESNTGALSLRPELLKHFAKKRAHLMTMIDVGKRDLQMK